MITSHSSIVLLAVITLFSAPTLRAAAIPDQPQSYTVSGVERRDEMIVHPGTTEFSVRRLLGEPARRLDSTTWAYHNFCPADPKRDTGNCTTLIVTFSEGKVTQLQLVNTPAEKHIAATLKAAAENIRAIATK